MRGGELVAPPQKEASKQMTAQQIYESALSLLPTRTSEDNSLAVYVPGWINLALQEALASENSIRASKGLLLLDKAPTVLSMTDEIPYSDELVRTALIYFLASLICKDDDDAYWSQDYRRRYISALAEYSRVCVDNIVDVYGGES